MKIAETKFQAYFKMAITFMVPLYMEITCPQFHSQFSLNQKDNLAAEGIKPKIVF